MNKVLNTYLLLLANVAAGLVILIGIDKIPMSGWFKDTATIAALVLLNIAYDIFFKQDVIKTYWATRKLWQLLPAVVAGTVIAFAPALLSLAFSNVKTADLHFNFSTSFVSVILTFVIVGWEELWFRGVLLNHANKYLSAINISLTIGLFFMLVHMLNPNIELIKKGPALFFAGALLTMLYFYYRSIWVPWGLHFGNNFFGDMFKAKNDTDPFFGGDGYLSAIILAAIFLFFAMRLRRSVRCVK